MHYREVDWLPEVVAYPELVAGYRKMGLEPLGCMVLDLGEQGIGAVAAEYDEETARRLLFENERPVPILVTPDREVAVEIGEFVDAPSVRLLTLLTNGVLVETLRRWDCIPVWPRALRRVERHLDLVSEMTAPATVVGGRTVVVADGLPGELLDAHTAHVASATSLYGAEPYCFESMADVVWLTNKAFAHAASVDGRMTGLLLRRIAAVVALAVLLVVLGFVWTPWAWLGAAVLVAAGWLAFPRALVRLRYRADIRPPFVAEVERS